MTRLLLAVVTTVAAVSVAQAGALRSVGTPAYDPPVNTPFSSRLIGLPGPERTCIKWCEFDDLPCDPPVYKQEDGRCTYRQ